jgi:integrase
MAKRNYNGEGTIYYSESRKAYIAQFTDPYTKKRRSLYSKDEKTLKKKLRDALKAAEEGKYISKSKATVPGIAEKIIERKHEANIMGSSAYLRALGTLKLINKSDLAEIPIQEVTQDDLQDFFNSLKDYSNSYISKIFQVVNSAFEEALKDDILLKNPMKYVLKPKSNNQDKKVEALTLEEHQKFLADIGNETYKNILLIAVNTGMRCGEILALQPQDIDLDNNVIKVSKTVTKTDFATYTLKKGAKTYAGTREIPFDKELKQVLINSLADRKENEFGLIFSVDGKIIRPSTMNNVFKKVCKRLNFEGDYNFHMLRHTFATRCIESGMPAHVLQKLLGHTDVSITINKYTSIFDKYKKEEFEKYLEYKKANNL